MRNLKIAQLYEYYMMTLDEETVQHGPSAEVYRWLYTLCMEMLSIIRRRPYLYAKSGDHMKNRQEICI